MKKIKLVLDTNIVISSLINKNSVIRDILLSDKILFYMPEFAVREIEKHKNIITEKSGLNEIEFFFTLNYLLRRVNVVKKDVFKKELGKAKQIMKDIDIHDSEFLALALALDCDGVFSNDRAFDKTDVKRWSVKEILDKLAKHTT